MNTQNNYENLIERLKEEKQHSTFTKNRKEEVDAFLEDIIKICYKHNMSLSHEDGHGEFQVDNLKEFNHSWLYAASDVRK